MLINNYFALVYIAIKKQLSGAMERRKTPAIRSRVKIKRAFKRRVAMHPAVRLEKEKERKREQTKV